MRPLSLGYQANSGVQFQGKHTLRRAFVAMGLLTAVAAGATAVNASPSSDSVSVQADGKLGADAKGGMMAKQGGMSKLPSPMSKLPPLSKASTMSKYA